MCESGSEHHPSWPDGPRSCIREPHRGFGWSVRPSWNRNYMTVQTPAHKQLWEEPQLRRTPRLTVSAARLAVSTKNMAGCNHRHPAMAWYTIPRYCCLERPSEAPEVMCLQGKVSSDQTPASWSPDAENILECTPSKPGVAPSPNLVQNILLSEKHKARGQVTHK